MKYLSIIVPMYNEENRIAHCVAQLSNYFKKQKYSYEVIFVDDGSTDNTVNVLSGLIKDKNNFKIIADKINHGKGYVVKRGVLASNGEWVLFTDADLSTPIEDLEKLFAYQNKFDVIIGSRYLKKDSIKVPQPFLRRAISRIGHTLISLTLNLPFADTQCGFKLFSQKSAKDIFSKMTINRWGFDMEILAIAKFLGYNIKEVAVTWYNDPNSKLRAGKAALDTFKELITIKSNLNKGVYGKSNK